MAHSDVITPYLETNFDELSSYDFYRLLFPKGSFDVRVSPTLDGDGKLIYDFPIYTDKNGERQYKYNAISVEITDKKKKVKRQRYDSQLKQQVEVEIEMPVVYRRTITDDLDEIEEMVNSKYFCLMAPLSYVGKTRSAKNARMCFGIVIDVDAVRCENGRPIGLENFLYQTTIGDPDRRPSPKIGAQPAPTAIVSSGTGYHLYYMLKKPIPLFEENVKNLQKLKKALTTKAWHDSITTIKSEKEIQQEGIFQGFRVVGTTTKKGSLARAFLTGEKIDIAYLNQFVQPKDRAKIIFPEKLTKKEKDKRKKEKEKRMQELKEKWPDWYQRRIVEGLPVEQFYFNRAIYDKHLERIENEATVGHRYWCIAMLAVFAAKSGVSEEELEKDAYSLQQLFDSLSVEDTNRFDEDDILAALEYYQSDYSFKLTREYISDRSGIYYAPQKRNLQSKQQHLWGDIWTVPIRDDDNEIVEWKKQANMCKANREVGYRIAVEEGRVGLKPKHKERIEQYIKENPEATPSEIARELGISRTTVYKWLPKK